MIRLNGSEEEREGQTNTPENDHPSCNLLLLSSHPLNKHQTSIHPILKERKRDDPSFPLFGSSHPVTPLREIGDQREILRPHGALFDVAKQSFRSVPANRMEKSRKKKRPHIHSFNHSLIAPAPRAQHSKAKQSTPRQSNMASVKTSIDETNDKGEFKR